MDLHPYWNSTQTTVILKKGSTSWTMSMWHCKNTRLLEVNKCPTSLCMTWSWSLPSVTAHKFPSECCRSMWAFSNTNLQFKHTHLQRYSTFWILLNILWYWLPTAFTSNSTKQFMSQGWHLLKTATQTHFHHWSTILSSHWYLMLQECKHCRYWKLTLYCHYVLMKCKLNTGWQSLFNLYNTWISMWSLNAPLCCIYGSLIYHNQATWTWWWISYRYQKSNVRSTHQVQHTSSQNTIFTFGQGVRWQKVASHTKKLVEKIQILKNTVWCN
jgi:hypothetical protein